MHRLFLKWGFRAVAALALLTLTAAAAAGAGEPSMRPVTADTPPPVSLATWPSTPPSAAEWNAPGSPPPDYFTRFLAESSHFLVENEAPYQAIDILARAEQRHPGHPVVIRRLLALNVSLGYWGEVERIASSWLKSHPDDREALSLRGFALIMLVRGHEAREDIEKALASDPDPDLRSYLEKLLREIKAWNRQVDETITNNLNTMTARIERMEREGDQAALDAYLKELAAQDQTRQFALTHRARRLLQSGNREEAEKMLEELLRRDDLDDAQRANFETTLAEIRKMDEDVAEQENLREEIARLQEAEDWTGLERLLTPLIAANHPIRTYALMLRGHARAALGRTEEADADYAAALSSPDLNELSRTYLVNQRADFASARRITQEWERVTQILADAADDATPEDKEYFLTDLATRPEFRTFALTQRGYLRLGRHRYDDAETDFRIVLDDPDLTPSARAEIETALADLARTREEALAFEKTRRLIADAEARSPAEREQIFTQLAQSEAHRAFALAARGNARISLGRYDEAEADFKEALARDDLDPDLRVSIETFIAERERQQVTAALLANLSGEAAALETAGDVAALETLYTRLIEAQPVNAYGFFGRGRARMSLGRYKEARADLTQALAIVRGDERVPLDDDNRIVAETLLAHLDDSQVNGRTPDNPLVDRYLGQAATALEAGRRSEAENELRRVEALNLRSENQEAQRLLLLARMAELDGRAADTLGYYRQVAQMTEANGTLRADALWRLGQARRDVGDKMGSLAFARRSLDAQPDAAWRHIMIGQWYLEDGQLEAAEFHLLRARTLGEASAIDAWAYRELARNRLNHRDRSGFHDYMALAIDLAGRDVEAGDPDAYDLYQSLREYHKQKYKRFGGMAYFSSTFFMDGDSLHQPFVELNWRFPLNETLRFEPYLQFAGTAYGSYAGNYPNPFGPGTLFYDQDLDMGNSLSVAAGFRLAHDWGWSLSADRVFAIGRYAEDDARVRMDLYKGLGTGLSTTRDRWAYASIYATANYGLNSERLNLYADGRLGYAFRRGERFVLVPFLGAVGAGLLERDGDIEDPWSLEAGPGLTFRWFAGEDHYFSHRRVYDLTLQYRAGLTHGRSDVLALNLMLSF